jgi:hypothetical protein
MINTYCSVCGLFLSVQDKFAGGKGACPRCKSRLRIPHPLTPDSPGFFPGARYLAERAQDKVPAGSARLVTTRLGASSRYQCSRCNEPFESLQFGACDKGRCPACGHINEIPVLADVIFPRGRVSQSSQEPSVDPESLAEASATAQTPSPSDEAPARLTPSTGQPEPETSPEGDPETSPEDSAALPARESADQSDVKEVVQQAEENLHQARQQVQAEREARQQAEQNSLSAREEMEALQAEATQAEQAVQAAQAELQKLRQQVENATSHAEEVSLQREQFDSAIASERQARQQAEQQASEAHQQLESIQAEAAQAEQTARQATEELERLRQQVTEATERTEEADAARARQQELEAQAQAVETAHREALEEIQQKMQAEQQARQAAEEETRRIREELEQLRNEARQAEAQAARDHEKLEAATRARREMEDAFHSAQDEIKRMRQEWQDSIGSGLLLNDSTYVHVVESDDDYVAGSGLVNDQLSRELSEDERFVDEENEDDDNPDRPRPQDHIRMSWGELEAVDVGELGDVQSDPPAEMLFVPSNTDAIDQVLDQTLSQADEAVVQQDENVTDEELAETFDPTPHDAELGELSSSPNIYQAVETEDIDDADPKELWYFSLRGESGGPVRTQTIRKMLLAGEWDRYGLLRRSDQTLWEAAEEFDEFKMEVASGKPGQPQEKSDPRVEDFATSFARLLWVFLVIATLLAGVAIMQMMARSIQRQIFMVIDFALALLTFALVILVGYYTEKNMRQLGEVPLKQRIRGSVGIWGMGLAAVGFVILAMLA